MHILQWIAVKASNVESANERVSNYLMENMGSEDNYTSWYDWFVVGGGRWNPNPDSQYEDDKSMTISYEIDPEVFRERVSQSMLNRKAEFDSYAKDVNLDIIPQIISEYDPSGKAFSLFANMYALKKLIDMAYGEWDYNSYFFDCENDTTTPGYMFEGIDKGDTNWYLIPVDFHF